MITLKISAYVCRMKQVVKISGNIADLYLYRPIQGMEDMVQELAQLPDNIQILRVFINSPGGSVYEGIALFNVLSRFGGTLQIFVDGIAASMAAVLTQIPGAKRYMQRNAKLMFHRVGGNVQGNSDNIRDYAAVMDSFETDLINIIAERSGVADTIIKETLFDGANHWFSAEEALRNKLIDGIVDSKLRTQPPTAEDADILYTFFDSQINNQLVMNEQILNILNLQSDANDQVVQEAIQSIIDQNAELTAQVSDRDQQITQLTAQIDSHNQARIDEMINNAMQAGKITAATRPHYEKLAKTDFDNFKAILDSIPTYKPIHTLINQDAKAVIPEKAKAWSFSDWQRNDGKGLERLKNEHPDLYNELYEQQFGNQPK